MPHWGTQYDGLGFGLSADSTDSIDLRAPPWQNEPVDFDRYLANSPSVSPKMGRSHRVSPPTVSNPLLHRATSTVATSAAAPSTVAIVANQIRNKHPPAATNTIPMSFTVDRLDENMYSGNSGAAIARQRAQKKQLHSATAGSASKPSPLGKKAKVK